MAAPQRGQAQTATVSVAAVIVARVDVGGVTGAGRASQGDSCGATGVREKPRLPDAHETTRQDVLDEAAEKLHGGERHHAALIAMGVVLPPEGDVIPVEGDQSVIADGDPVRIATEVAQHGRSAPKRRLRADDPISREERIDEGVPLRRVAQVFGDAGQIEFMPVVRAAERLDKLPAKDATEHLHGKEEVRVLWTDPKLMIRGKPPAGTTQWTCG